MTGTIRIGTASWTDPGFVQDWYPAKLPASDRLRWYSEHFNYVEVNSTFYAIPNARTVERWCLETPPEFVFDIKLPKLLSRHAMPAKFLPADLRAQLPLSGANVKLTQKVEESVTRRMLRELQPLFHYKKFGAFLLQFSPAFRPKSHRLEELDSLRDLLAPHRLAVELRNRDWVIEARMNEAINFFRSRELSFVMVDAPESQHFTVMPGLNCITDPRLVYFRFHGRNEQGYISGRTVAERFDYDYSDEEIEELTGRIRNVAAEAQEVHVVANNNRSNYAPRLAERIQRQLRESNQQ